MLSKNTIKKVQSWLKKDGFNPGPIDGLLGRKTLGVISKQKGVKDTWSAERQVVAYIQSKAKKESITVGKIDGLWGPMTDHAYDQLKVKTKEGLIISDWRDTIIHKNPNKWPKETQSNFEKHFGKVGENQVRLKVPYKHVIAWDTEKSASSFLCHEKVHDSLERVLNNVLSAYGEKEIHRLGFDLFGGCLNVRKKRGGSEMSTHSWGIAVDYDPSHNKLRWGMDRARFAKPEYLEWWKIWEAEGWVSLGRQRNFDWMHIQAAKV